MDSIFDKISDTVIHKFEPPVRKIPTREKHFNTAIATMIGLILATVPLIYGYVPVKTPDNLVTFRVEGTWMQLGTQPFVFASMVAGYIFDKDEHLTVRSKALGFIFSIFLALKWSFWNQHHWFCAVQLVAVSYIILQAVVYLETRGSVHISTALICAHASKNMLQALLTFTVQSEVAVLAAIVLILLVCWVEELMVTIPLTHMRRKSQNMSMQLPIMYNSTTALVMHYTIIDVFSGMYAPLAILQSNTIEWSTLGVAVVLFSGLYYFNQNLPEMEEKTGRHLIKNWNKQQYTIKGWRSQQKMAQYIQRIVDRNVYWNTIILFGLWCVGVFFKPPISVTTLFILTSTAKKQITQPISSLLN
jgi:preprotein translocase subunit SecY